MSAALLVRAARLLESGPRHTLELAREVLGLRGNAPAASQAVFTLLGADSRFTVDVEGVWTLRDGARPGVPLSRASFAVVDIETTGGSWSNGHRITEVAVVPVAEGRVGEPFESLVNPGRPIPPRVQGLTGITDAMVASAPPFEGIAPRVGDALTGRVFVAHNVRFDWGFVREEVLLASGDAPALPLLCTLRLGRLLVPGLRSYALDGLAHHFRIPVHRRHRAAGDALAAARLLIRLLAEAETRGIADLEALEAALQRTPRARRPGARRRRRS